MPATADLAALETPALLLDAPRMAANIARMQQRVQALGVAFRPHVKTAQCLPVARAMLGAQRGPVTVATLLRILPNHACATAAQFGAYQVLDDAGRVGTTWPRFGGW